MPVWDPGGEVSQFAALLRPLRVTRLGAQATTVVEPESAERDDDATELPASAASLLQDDLVRNEPHMAEALSVGWDRLREFQVRIDPDLRVRVAGLAGRQPIDIDVATKADVTRDVLFLRDPRLLRQVEAGGRAIASLFATADRRQLAQAWLAACVAADEGRIAQQLELAAQQAADERARTEKEMAERAAALGREIADRQGGPARRRPARAAGPAAGAAAGTTPPSPTHSPSRGSLSTRRRSRSPTSTVLGASGRHGHLLHLDISRPTRGLKVQFAYGSCGIRRVNVVDYIASSRQPGLSRLPAAGADAEHRAALRRLGPAEGGDGVCMGAGVRDRHRRGGRIHSCGS